MKKMATLIRQAKKKRELKSLASAKKLVELDQKICAEGEKKRRQLLALLPKMKEE